jgi:hypothetical protein
MRYVLKLHSNLYTTVPSFKHSLGLLLRELLVGEARRVNNVRNRLQSPVNRRANA